ncbi:ribosomal RNA small subunit methyltransferase A [Candidatus Saccharibacteria bacterium CPR2]|nr:ribosomal RNA small subunit methyltransferase A [Candidatus Saccharibacteria bacterium CPR2]
MQDIPKKRLGQHWLKNDDALKAMCDAGEVNQGDTVLEIGPGLGHLTEKILQRGANLIAVEKDHDLAKNLLNNISKFTNHESLKVVCSDIRDFNLLDLPKGYKVVANIPYYLTSNLIRQLLSSQNPPSLVALLVQKEVAERITAKTGSKSLLTIAVELFAEPELGEVIPAKLFDPPPKVDSRIVILKVRDNPKFPVDQKRFFQLVKAGFSNKRKKLKSSLSGGLCIGRPEIEKILDDANIDKNARAQALALDDWHKLYQVWIKAKL